MTTTTTTTREARERARRVEFAQRLLDALAEDDERTFEIETDPATARERERTRDYARGIVAGTVVDLP